MRVPGSDGLCEGGQLSPSWYDWYAEFVLEISSPPSPNTTFGPTSESQFCDHGWGLTKCLLVLWYFVVKSIQLQVSIVRSSKLVLHSATQAVAMHVHMCPAERSGIWFGSPVQPGHLGEQSTTSSGWRTGSPSLLWVSLTLFLTPVLWPSRSVSTAFAAALVILSALT